MPIGTGDNNLRRRVCVSKVARGSRAAFIVGKRMRFHTLVVFIAIVGGIALFGASGIVLGPVVLAVADALLDIWRRRTANGGVLEQKSVV